MKFRDVFYLVLVASAVYFTVGIVRYLPEKNTKGLLMVIMAINLGGLLYFDLKLSKHMGWCRGRICK